MHINQSKRQQLQQHGAWNERADAVTHPLFGHSEFFDPQDLVLVKYEMLRAVRVEKTCATDAARQFGFSRSGYYKVLASFRQSGIAGLIPSPPGPRGAHKLNEDLLDFVDGCLAKDRTLSSMQLAALVLEQHKLSVHPRSIERALTRREKKGR
jgi:transposase